MFQNESTLWIEILVIVLVLSFIGYLVARHFYRKAKGLPTGECACCASKKNSLVKQYNKKYH